MLFVFVLNKKAMPVVEELKEFSSVADDPSGATGCTTHGINPKLVILLIDTFPNNFIVEKKLF